MEHKEENIVKKVCKELNITQKELAEMLEVSTSAVSLWSKGEIPKMAQLALELMIKTKEQEEKLNIIRKAKDIINSI